MGRETLGSMMIQGIGLNLTGLWLLLGTGLILGPLGWTGTGVAITLKLIGDGQLIRAYWLWRAQHAQPVPPTETLVWSTETDGPV